MRAIAWFSCGAISAVMVKLAVEKYGDRCIPVYCNTMVSEHPDNRRFLRDVETWISRKVTILSSEKYENIDNVFEKTRYMAGPFGARCTVEMKKVPRFNFQKADDIHLFGFSYEEQKRISDFENRNPELYLDWILIDQGVTRAKAFDMLLSAGIRLPEMYMLGYKNNNCIGCVKATSPGYWNHIRRDFPEVFKRRAKLSRELDIRLTRVKGKRIFLDKLDSSIKTGWKTESVSCGPECGQMELL